MSTKCFFKPSVTAPEINSKLARVQTSLSFKEILTIYITHNGFQTDNITYNHEEENNHQVMNELKVFC